MKQSLGRKLEKSSRLIPLPDAPEPETFRCVSFLLPDDDEYAAVFWGHLIKMTYWMEWERDELKRGKDMARFWMKVVNEARKRWLGIGDNACGGDEHNCVTYSPNAPFISYYPQNPYTQPNVTPDGYATPCWRVVLSGDTELQTLGYQAGDIANVGVPLSAGDLNSYPKFIVHTSSDTPVTVELHFITHPLAGLFLVSVDNSPFNVQWVDVNRELLQVPQETNVEVIIELVVQYGEHDVYVTLVPTLDVEEIPIGWGGAGLRSVVICGEMSFGDMDVRQNPELPCILEKDTGSGWEQFANLQLCPPKIRYNGAVIEYYDDTNGWTPIDTVPPVESEGDEFPPPTPRNELTEQERLCAAVANAMKAFNLMHYAVQRDIGSSFPEVLAAGIISVLTPAIFFPPSLVVTLPIIVTAMATFALVTGESFTPDIKRKFSCILLEHATDNGGIVTFNHGEILTDVFTRVPQDTMWFVLWYYLQIIQSGGLNLAGATALAQDIDCPECDDAWCRLFNFLPSQDGWERMPYTNPDKGVWVVNLGWAGTGGGQGQIEKVKCHITFPSRLLTHVSLTIYSTHQTTWVIRNEETGSIWKQGTVGSGTWLVGGDGTAFPTGNLSLEVSVAPSQTCRITNARVKGLDGNPFTTGTECEV